METSRANRTKNLEMSHKFRYKYNKKVEIIIFPYPDSEGANIEEMGGVLSRYKKTDRQILEKEAWAKAVLADKE